MSVVCEWCASVWDCAWVTRGSKGRGGGGCEYGGGADGKGHSPELKHVVLDRRARQDEP